MKIISFPCHSVKGRCSKYNNGFTASHVNAVSLILDRPVDLLKLESKNTVDTYCWYKQKNQQLRNSTSTRNIVLNYRIQNFFLRKPDTWVDSSRKPLNWKCTYTT